ncbi:MAG: FHA domain-containing protein [Candidatus Thiodiazotropha sp. (ex Epidulcina cf. delphinae)]|nr:FHA domain-containing protein [Candidatus Thiodiazotropha sp. (ex Epidulcina cf. delphinae)]
MEKLVVMSDDEAPQEYRLIDKRLLIGRDETCDMCLSDRSVSRHHATLMRVFRGFSIEDERSTNGTKVNGTVINKRFLKHGDLIEIGKYRMRYIAQPPERDMDDPDRTVVLRPTHRSELTVPSAFSAAPMTPPTAGSAPVAGETDKQRSDTHTAQEPQAKVRFLSGEHRGEEKVVDRAFFSVGRPGGDLVLINHRHSGYFLLKVGGENNPMINGDRIRAGGVELHNGDRIDLGELSLEFIG